MTLKEVIEWLKSNAKKWDIIEQSENQIVISKNKVNIIINKDEITWKTEDNENTIPLSEENLKVLTSRDWIPQIYCRSFGYIARTDTPNEDIWPEDFVQYFHDNYFGFVTSIKWDAYGYKGRGTIYAETECSLDRQTLNDLNHEIDVQISDGVGESCDLISLVSDSYFYKDK